MIKKSVLVIINFSYIPQNQIDFLKVHNPIRSINFGVYNLFIFRPMNILVEGSVGNYALAIFDENYKLCHEIILFSPLWETSKLCPIAIVNNKKLFISYRTHDILFDNNKDIKNISKIFKWNNQENIFINVKKMMEIAIIPCGHYTVSVYYFFIPHFYDTLPCEEKSFLLVLVELQDKIVHLYSPQECC